MKIKYDELKACVDCVMYLANGEVPDERPGLEKDIASQWPTESILVLTGNEEEEEFSRSSCDCCGSNLAGSRSGFVVLEEEN